MQENSSNPIRGKISPYVVALSFLPWLFLLYLLVANYAVHLSDNDKTIIGNFIEWFGTAYSLFLAIVLGYVWAQFDNLDREFDSEADALAALHQTSKYISEIISTESVEGLDNERKRKILDYIDEIEKGIVAYMKHVIQYFEKEYDDARLRERGQEILEKIGLKISLITYDGSTPDAMVSELFSKLNEALDTRGDRLAHSRQRMPTAVWWVALVSSIIWLLPFLALIIDNDLVFFLLVGGAAFVIVMVLIIVKDLDEPFDGVWKVKIDSWHDFLETLEHTKLVFVYNIRNAPYDRMLRTSLGRQFRRRVCNLRYLTYNWMTKRQSWNELSFRMLDQGDIVTKELLVDQYLEEPSYRDIGGPVLPVILYGSPANMELLLSAEDIDRCDSLQKLNEEIRKKLDERHIHYSVSYP